MRLVIPQKTIYVVKIESKVNVPFVGMPKVLDPVPSTGNHSRTSPPDVG